MVNLATVGLAATALLGLLTVPADALVVPHSAPVGGLSPGCSRTAVVTMKGKGSRGIPGKMRQQKRENAGMKRRMQKRDFQKREWVQVLSSIEEDLGSLGATKAVTAGRSPKGQEFIWCLLRGADADADAERDEADGAATVYAVDGACRCCQFPMTAAKLRTDSGVAAVECSLCGTTYDLKDGNVIEFLPKRNPAQWAAALANESKGPQRMVTLPARVSKAGKVYVRLPDGTLL